ncbi:hypothetical protein ENKNEFLB_02089 [Nocardioides aquaticus]|uniref:Secreted protein n=1 Tax=Nocardioides aquaticus TaxID=160826 RepID=A0ABX8EHF9_9ACTN|nr:hypothetical protein [Nocardioides aquaticus]QVT79699.1 hypothetical protein ENKNEFLB_02089 [Nocardioides aquaticus]
MKRTATGVLAALTIGLGAQVIAPAPASADTPGCVSRKEYRNLPTNGTLTRGQVAKRYDTNGDLLNFEKKRGKSYETRAYAVCTDDNFGRTEVLFVKDSDKPRRFATKKTVFWG